jgi:protein-tyrosine phosphatase
MESDSFADAISEIIPGFLFIGGCNAPANVGFFTDRGVRYALQVGEDAAKAPVDKYLQIKLADTMTEDLARYWDKTNAFLREAKQEAQAVLVYDFSGVSRAPAIVLAYLMAEERLLLKEGLMVLRDRRRWVNPNMHFMEVLSDLEQQLFGVRSVRVVHDDREKAHLEFPENVELPQQKQQQGDSGEDKKDKKKKKKKKKEKKEKQKGTLRFKSAAPPPAAAEPTQPKRLKRDKFAFANDDVYGDRNAQVNRRITKQ